MNRSGKRWLRSMSAIVHKTGVRAPTIRRWFSEGLPHETHSFKNRNGRLQSNILVNKILLKEWLETRTPYDAEAALALAHLNKDFTTICRLWNQLKGY